MFILSPLETSVNDLICKAIELDRCVETLLKDSPEHSLRKEKATRCFWVAMQKFSPINYTCLRRRSNWDGKEISDLPLSDSYSKDLLKAYLLDPKQSYQRPESTLEFIESIQLNHENLSRLKNSNRTFYLALDFAEIFLLERDESISEREHKKIIITLFDRLPRIFRQTILLNIHPSLPESIAMFYRNPFLCARSILLFRDKVLTSHKTAFCELTSMLDYSIWLDKQKTRTDRVKTAVEHFNSIYFYERDCSIKTEEHFSLIIDMFELLPKFIKLWLLEKIALKHGIKGDEVLDAFYENPITYQSEVKETIAFFSLPV